MDSISMDRVEYDSFGRPFVAFSWKGRPYVRCFGDIVNCKVCNRQFFHIHGRKLSGGRYCSSACSLKARSLNDYKAVERMPYSGNCSWAYVAGFFDGEGTVYISKIKSNVRLAMSQKDPSVLQEIQCFLASHGIGSFMAVAKDTGTHSIYIGNMFAVYKFVMKVQNHCFVKLDKLWNARVILWEKIARHHSEEEL